MSEKLPEAFMREAIELSRRGYPAPNPRVGCVIVRSGEVVGRGHHDYAGGAHAEVVALLDAGDRAHDADVYVTLEPCDHQGRTGPCTIALINAGVKRVFYAVADPNPRAAGGAARLREAGIEVSEGLLAQEAAAVNHIFLAAMKLGRPFVVAKAAMSMDGKIATAKGESKWITGPCAREQGHRLRAEMGAVLVGAGTVRCDNPKLTARIDGVVNQPVRIILDPADSLPKDANVFSGPGVFYQIIAGPPKSANQIQLSNCNGLIDVHELLQELWSRNITSVLVEGGGKTIGEFLKSDLVDRLELFIAPIVIGEGLPWSGGFKVENLTDSPRFKVVATQLLAEDVWVTAERNRK